MDYVGIEAIRKEYAQEKIDNGDYKRGLQIYEKDIQTPTFEGLAFHPETEPLKETVNNALRDISIDFVSLENELIHTANSYTNVINNMLLRLETADQQIQVERDRIKDINAICGQYDAFSSVKSYVGTNVLGNYGWVDNAFTGQISDKNDDFTLTVVDVSGNGVNGNEYVKDAINSSEIYLTDESDLTRWEYSRFTASSIPKGSTVPVNGDTEEARATVTLVASENIQAIKISSEYDIVVEDVLISLDDGATYVSTLSKEIRINDPDAKYDDPEYAYDTGIIAFPSTSFIKIRFRSSGVTNDTVIDGDGNELPGVKRHAIIVNNIKGYNTKYSSGEFYTWDMVAAPVDCIAVFANEYVPSHYPAGQDYIRYILTVNGIDYNVVPINSNRTGTKMIRFSDYTVNDSYITHLKEPIKSATLKVLISPTPAGETPFISNLKICIGKVVS